MFQMKKKWEKRKGCTEVSIRISNLIRRKGPSINQHDRVIAIQFPVYSTNWLSLSGKPKLSSYHNFLTTYPFDLLK